MRNMKRVLSLVLALIMIVGLLPMSVFATDGESKWGNFTGSKVQYIMLGSDRHGQSEVIPALLEQMENDLEGENNIDYVGLLGDMVNSTNSYNTANLLSEVNEVETHLTYKEVDVVYASHDKGTVTDANGMLNKTSGNWYSNNYFHIYGVIQDDVSGTSAASTASSNFKTWVDSLASTDNRPIIVISHFPLHDKRGDNKGAYYWHQALNYAATGATSGSSTIKRDVLFFHGHNHTEDSTEYYYAVGSTMAIENDGDTENETIYYSYATAGYMLTSSNSGAKGGNGHATLLTISESKIGLSRYDYETGLITSSSEYAYDTTDGTAEIVRVNKVPQQLRVTGKVDYTVGDSENDTIVDPTKVEVTFLNTATNETTTETIDSGYSLTKVTKVVDGVETEMTLTNGTYTFTEKGTYNLTYTCTIGTYKADAILQVEAKAAEDPVLNTISVTTMPTKVTYLTGETLDTAGMVVTGTYSDGTTATLTGWYTSTVDMTTAGEKTVTVYYVEDSLTFQTTFTITVEEGLAENVYLTGIAITKPLTKTEYLLSEELALDGMVVTATFSDGTTREIAYKPFSTSTYYGGYELDNFSMYVEKAHEVKVTYTLNGVTCTATTTINVWNEDFTDETTGVKVHVSGDYGVTGITVADSANTYVSAAIAGVIKGDAYKAYDISLNFDEGYSETDTTKTVTLPIPDGVTTPVVYYVPNDGGAAVLMESSVKDGFVVFETTHFSTYVVGETTEITVPDPEIDEGITGTTTTTIVTEKEVYVLVESIDADGDYLIVNTDSSTTSANLLTAASSGVTNTSGVTVATGKDANGNTVTYIENPAAAAIWTASGSSTWTLYNSSTGRYLRYNNGLTTTSSSNDATSWYSDTNVLYRRRQSQNQGYPGSSGSSYTYYYVRYNSGWTVTSSSSTTSNYSVYIYQKQTVKFSTTTTTTTTGDYRIDADKAEITATVIPNDTLTLGSYVTFTPDSGTATITDTDTTATYTVVDGGDPNGIISGISGNVVTFTGKTGKALVKVSYTGTVGETTYTVSNYILITAVKRDYKVTINITSGGTTSAAGTMETVKQGTTLDLSNTTITYVDGNGVVQTVSGESITWTESSDLITIENGVVRITSGVEGEASLTASWVDPYGNTITDTLTLNIVDAIWSLDLVEPIWTEVASDATFDSTATYYTKNDDGTYTQVSITEFASGTTYYTLTYKSIEAPIVVKDVVANQTYSNVWAVIYKDGVDQGKLSDTDLEKLTFVSSNTGIATVDANGTVTFTGKSGTVIITAVYEYADGKSVTDTVIFSVSSDHYYVPEDGTDDFPEYPNEGSIRFDKTATAVGNFSETGIAKVELSMTGVPYTEGAEIDVVVMLDMTGSMSDNGMEAAELATIAFVEKIVKNEDGTYNNNRIAVYAFNSGSSSPYELVSLKSITSDEALATASTAIKTASDKQTDGGTPFDAAAQKCHDVLAAAKTDGIGNNRQQFCVFMSDGGPTSYAANDGDGTYTTITNSGSGTTAITTYFTGYSSSTSSSWTFSLPTEYYTDDMKADGVTIYTVGLLMQNVPSNPSPYSSMTASTYDSTTDSLTTIGSHYYFTSSVLKQMASSEENYIDIFSVDTADNAVAKFTSIAQKIMEAAKDVQVVDKITDDFTMVFDFPNAVVEQAAGSSQEFYIEFMDYALVPVYSQVNITGFTAGTVYYTKSGTTYTKATSYVAGTTYYVISDYTRGTGTSMLKLYIGVNSDGSYYAATANGSTNGANAFTTPIFNTTALGTKYYWTTDSAKGDSGISVSGSYTDSDGNTQTATFYFVSDGTGTYNMASGAYAYGTPTTDTYDVSVGDGADTETRTTTTCQNMIIATPYFVYNAATRKLVWTVEKLAASEYALSYFVYLAESGGYEGSENEAEAKSYQTNEYAYLYYTNYQGDDCKVTFPVPQVTWNGAQVSYVFYLVNEDGQPVNRAGKVVPMSEAVYVTDVFTYAIVWNRLEQAAGLEAERLAAALVPSVYQLYDAGAVYRIHVYEDEEYVNLNNHFVIESGKNVYTTYVFNTKADAIKYNVPGTYVAYNSDNAIAGKTYLCKSYSVKDAAYTTSYDSDGNPVYTVTAATYVAVDGETQWAPGDGDSYTGGTKIGNYVYYVDENGAVYTIVEKSDGTETYEGFDYANTTVAFAVLWKPQLEEDTVVVDFGLDVVIDVTTNDALASGVVGVRTDAPSDVLMGSGTYNAAKNPSVTLTLGDLDIATATIESLNAVRVSLNRENGMQFTAPLVFYYESAVNYYIGTELQTTSMYSKVTVIPATMVYYEDDYVTYSNSSKADDTYGTWTDVGTASNATQDQDRPGESKISEDMDADNNYGYDSAYESMSTWSMGSAKKITVKSGVSGMASFTFYGTGFDVISVTDSTTGLILVRVMDESNTVIKTLTVDTYYGYVKNFYKVTYKYDNETAAWVASESASVDENAYNTAVDAGALTELPEELVTTETYVVYEAIWEVSSTDTALYQVPVMKVDDLDYGKYTVQIIASYQSMFDHTETGSYTFYLDAIRIYDPTGNANTDANNAYKEDGEGWPEYTELRNQIISADTFNSLGTTDTTVEGVVFIDGVAQNFSVEDYTNYGPNNELYLAYGQAIAFKLNATASAGEVAKIQIGIKTVGGTGSVQIYSVNADGTVIKTAVDQQIATATDMYYDITVLNGQNVVIRNNGESTGAIISLTNIKVTYTKEQPAVAAASEEVTINSTEAAGYSLMSLRSNVNTISTTATTTASDVVSSDVETTEETTYLLSVSAEMVAEVLEALNYVEPEIEEPEVDEPEIEEPEVEEPEIEEPEVEEPEHDEKPGKPGKPGDHDHDRGHHKDDHRKGNKHTRRTIDDHTSPDRGWRVG